MDKRNILKRAGLESTNLSPFDLYGDNELALSKAFAYLISKDKKAFRSFLRLMNKQKYIKFKNAEIIIEKVRKEGRTDIEILSRNDNLHIIIECKVGKNRLEKQLKQYRTSFECEKKIMCFITQERDANMIKDENVEYHFFSWLDIINNFEKLKLENKNIQEFVSFVNRRFKMKNVKEILVQDLGDQIELERFLKYKVYRRDITFGTPLYFAPYFTRRAKDFLKKIKIQPFEGIKFISKVLGVLTINPIDIDSFSSDLNNFSLDKNLIRDWIKGVKMDNNNINAKYTFYFLDEPFELRTPLIKAKGNKKGVGKNWIAKAIPKNRTIDFIDFLKHIPELSD